MANADNPLRQMEYTLLAYLQTHIAHTHNAIIIIIISFFSRQFIVTTEWPMPRCIDDTGSFQYYICPLLTDRTEIFPLHWQPISDISRTSQYVWATTSI